ncbi:MAG: glutamate-1-semialdehyde 2,1-aminomutase [Defluviitaleaceae bacterium]|nr:glutamate-1-semialdehyde 2,1-aminomutase [Defluviitaleaceae bacterium]
MKHEKSAKLYQEACQYIPGGVNSPVRAFKSVGLAPIFVSHAHGSRIEDIDGNSYLDYICSWGPLMFGHSPEFLTEGLLEVVQKGTSYGMSTPIEVEVAKLIVQAHPAVKQVRMVNSGTEATMSALRVAKGYTGRNKILKFEGCYHGHSDALLVKSGSATLTYGVPTSLGVATDVIKDTLVGTYNDVEGLQQVFEQHGNELAAVIVEPVAGNMGVISATKTFLEEMRRLCTEFGTVLIFDEVITGFRIGYQSAAGYFGVTPDMACFGKIIGAGLPVGAYGGKAEIMALVSPVGPVYQAGTLSGNPLAMHMGKKNLEMLRDNRIIYEELEQKGKKLATGLRESIKALDLGYTVNQVGSLVTLFFAKGPIENHDDVMKADMEAFNRYFTALLNQGILIPPTQFEAMFLSQAHTDEDIELTIKACHKALEEATRKK